MLKKISAIIFILFFISNHSQTAEEIRAIVNFSSDKELMVYIDRVKEKGLKLIEIENLAKAQGASSDEIKKLRELWNFKSISKETPSLDNEKIKTSFGSDNELYKINTYESDSLVKSDRFGSNFFNNKNISETPELYLATPNDYTLGPGDEIIIQLYGASESTYSVEISREGSVKIDRLAPIYLSGLTISRAKSRLKSSLTKIYTGLSSDNEISKVYLDLSLLKARSIVVNIIGQVKVPGTYTISGFSSVLNALFAAGGPNEIGSYRKIQILREGKQVSTIDLYKYFSNGTFPNNYLRDQDVIFVPPYEKQIESDGAFKINGKFELLDSESINDFLNYNGGFLSNGIKNKIFIERLESDLRTSFIEIEFNSYENYIPNDGDFLTAKFPNEGLNLKNIVKIGGEVTVPGDYSLDKAIDIDGLIKLSKGLTEKSLSNRGILFRHNNGIKNEIKTLDLSNQNDLKFKLKNLDSLFIPDLTRLESLKVVTTIGNLNDPKVLTFRKNMTLIDALIQSGGFSSNADNENINVYRNISSQNKSKYSENFVLNVDKDFNSPEFPLEPGDLIIVKKVKNYKPLEFFSVKGEVENQGDFGIENSEFNIQDALEKIELKSSADLDGIHILRNNIRIPVFKNRMNINSENFQIFNGDEIIVPKINNTVSVRGAIQNESILPFEKNISLKSYISGSGGFLENSDRGNVYITYSNGKSVSTKKILGIIKKYPKVLPGAKITVPEKTEREKRSIAEVLSITSGITSLIALIRIIQQN